MCACTFPLRRILGKWNKKFVSPPQFERNNSPLLSLSPFHWPTFLPSPPPSHKFTFRPMFVGHQGLPPYKAKGVAGAPNFSTSFFLTADLYFAAATFPRKMWHFFFFVAFHPIYFCIAFPSFPIPIFSLYLPFLHSSPKSASAAHIKRAQQKGFEQKKKKNGTSLGDISGHGTVKLLK